MLRLEVSPGYQDTSLASGIVARFSSEFWKKHWPWEPRSEVSYDPRAPETDAKKRASLPPKLIILDRKKALITSANFIEPAQ